MPNKISLNSNRVLSKYYIYYKRNGLEMPVPCIAKSFLMIVGLAAGIPLVGVVAKNVLQIIIILN
jgi:hypothetical protein